MMLASPSQKTGPTHLPDADPRGQRLANWLSVLSIGLFSCSLMGHVLGRFYFFELFSHFVIQYEWLSVGFLGLWLIYGIAYRKRIKWILPVLSVALLIGTVYLNRTTWVAGDYDEPIPTARGDVRVLHANVLYSRDEYVTTVTMLKKHRSDLYMLQEMTPDKIRLVTSQVRTEFPYWFACPSKQQVWTLVGSRTPFLVDQALVRKHHIISLTTKLHGRAISLLTVHPHTPIVPDWFRERNEQLTYAANKTRHNALPTVLIGDFNISPFSPIYQEIFEPDSQSGASRRWTLTAARQTKTQPTWPRFLPPMMIPIDHAFVNGGFSTQSFRTLAQPGSDHRAVLVDLNLL